MKDVLKRYLRENFDDEVKIRKWENQRKLPLIFHQKYNFYKTELLDKDFLLIEVSGDSSNIDELKKHMKILAKYTNENSAFLFKNTSQYKRKLLLKERIPFIIENGQMFLPFLGLDLNKMTKTRLKTVEKFSPVTQLIYLFFLYNKNLEKSSTELAKIFDFSQMHLLRALNDLYDLDLIHYKIGGKTNRSKIYRRIGDPDYYLKGREFLRNPINRIAHVDKVPDEYSFAGLDALSRFSMINPPDYPVLAVSKEEAKRLSPHFIKDMDRVSNEKPAEIQIWNYDPEYLKKDGIVDILSLSLTLEDLNDERVKQSIVESLRKESWYKE